MKLFRTLEVVECWLSATDREICVSISNCEINCKYWGFVLNSFDLSKQEEKAPLEQCVTQSDAFCFELYFALNANMNCLNIENFKKCSAAATIASNIKSQDSGNFNRKQSHFKWKNSNSLTLRWYQRSDFFRLVLLHCYSLIPHSVCLSGPQSESNENPDLNNFSNGIVLKYRCLIQIICCCWWWSWGL